MLNLLKKKLIITAFFLLYLIGGPQSAKAYTCSDFSLNPSTISPGQSFNVVFSPGLIANEFVSARIEGTTTTGSLNCTDNPSLCSSRPTNLFSLATTSESGTRYVAITYIDSASARLDCQLSVDVSPEIGIFCGPVGMSGVNPSSGSVGTTFLFNGCIGSNPSNGTSRVVVRQTGGTFLREIPLSNAGGQVQADGQFSNSIQVPSAGIYTAELYVGTSQTGSISQFVVDAGGATEGEPCNEVISCTTSSSVAGTQTCIGTWTAGGASGLTCSYTAAGCSTCAAPSCGDEICSADELNSSSCPIDCAVTIPELKFYLCTQIPSGGEFAAQKAACESCQNISGDTNTDTGIWTAVGCIRANPESIVKQVITLGLSIGGGVALLMILASGFIFSTSQGDPKRVTDARELLTSAVIGLLFIIFSITILQFIGFTIFRIPGFGTAL